MGNEIEEMKTSRFWLEYVSEQVKEGYNADFAEFVEDQQSEHRFFYYMDSYIENEVSSYVDDNELSDEEADNLYNEINAARDKAMEMIKSIF